MSGQNDQQHVSQELEVLRIHMQFVTVQLTQLSKGTLKVVHVLDGISKGGQHLLAMCLDLGVSHDGRGRGQVAKASPPVSSMFTWPHCLLIMHFSSGVKCTMVSRLGACW
uniref:Uncharacterized protein n=1 Tax=Oryctolagus cuniculus TaxID=9986 RepID=A0A5F9D1Y0_RABIT